MNTVLDKKKLRRHEQKRQSVRVENDTGNDDGSFISVLRNIMTTWHQEDLYLTMAMAM